MIAGRLAVAALAAIGALCAAFPASPESAAGGSSTVAMRSREAYSQPSPALPADRLPEFFLGRALFRQVWVIPPALDSDVDGLGPTFNRPSCVACHLKNGRGFAPEAVEDPLRTMLVRISIPGTTDKGAPLPHPAYGDQLNDAAVPGVPREGRVLVHWQYRTERFADGSTIELRKPAIEFAQLAFGPVGDDLLLSPRIGSPVFGLGLLEAVSDAALHAQAAREKPDGITGRVNLVWDESAQQKLPGRFGWKANVATLRQQVASALLGDLGITSPVLPRENCPPVQVACASAVNGGDPEISEAQLRSMVLYQQALAVPAARTTADPAAMRGKAVFMQAGCQHCHLPQLQTGAHPEHAWLSNQIIQPYTDLLLHDMGEALADGRPDFEASGRQWRTAPLWGIGLTKVISDREGYLHDGRARTLMEAIMWHGGEAQAARERVRSLGASERADLIRFLESL